MICKICLPLYYHRLFLIVPDEVRRGGDSSNTNSDDDVDDDDDDASTKNVLQNVPPGSSAPSLTTSAKHEFDGVGRSSNVSFKFLRTLWVFRTCIRNKNCHQHSYGFQNLMSSWGWGNIIFEITIFT